ncbi:hypothetical protein ACFQ7B_32610 [Streptomyces erythrochromogenes]|uniref:hypothetical protein n=1 Tax=Streptomyces erythrochromogenes TaxID=285574 RepID=UPI0036AC7471
MFKINQGASRRPSSRALVLAVLGAITLGVALLSVSVSYESLVPRFGDWAVPTVAALDALWVVVQTMEIVAANNRERARRVWIAGLVLTVVVAAIPTVGLILTLSRAHAFDLAVVIAPTAIILTKIAWWVVLPSLGRGTSAGTRSTIATTRQAVADRLEEMEAKAADRIELLRVASEVQQRVAEAETQFRLVALAAQQSMTAALHAQAEATADTIAAHPLPALVAGIDLPGFDLDGDGELPALALPVHARRHARHTGQRPAGHASRHTRHTRHARRHRGRRGRDDPGTGRTADGRPTRRGAAAPALQRGPAQLLPPGGDRRA